jgi:hypothetical protein
MSNISKALKEKNRITGKINKLQQQLYTFNRYEKGKTPDLDAKKVMKSLQEEWAFLIDLKTRIAKANVGIAEKLIRLSEAKAELKFWTGFINAGPSEEVSEVTNYDYKLGQHVTKEVTKVSVFTSKEILESVDAVQSLIEKYQDEVDDYNATTQI